MKKHIALDFDGVVVGNEWPGMGKPEPNAAAVIKRLSDTYDITIFTSRIAGWDVEGVRRSGRTIAKEIRAIDRKLKMMGLGYLPIWQCPWKVGADLYLDDKALHYAGDWLTTEQEIVERLG